MIMRNTNMISLPNPHCAVPVLWLLLSGCSCGTYDDIIIDDSFEGRDRNVITSAIQEFSAWVRTEEICARKITDVKKLRSPYGDIAGSYNLTTKKISLLLPQGKPELRYTVFHELCHAYDASFNVTSSQEELFYGVGCGHNLMEMFEADAQRAAAEHFACICGRGADHLLSSHKEVIDLIGDDCPQATFRPDERFLFEHVFTQYVSKEFLFDTFLAEPPTEITLSIPHEDLIAFQFYDDLLVTFSKLPNTNTEIAVQYTDPHTLAIVDEHRLIHSESIEGVRPIRGQNSPYFMLETRNNNSELSLDIYSLEGDTPHPTDEILPVPSEGTHIHDAALINEDEVWLFSSRSLKSAVGGQAWESLAHRSLMRRWTNKFS